LTKFLSNVRRNLAVQDYVCASYHLFMLLRVVLAPNSDSANSARWANLGLLLLTVSTVLLIRSEVLHGKILPGLIYRIGVFGPMVLSYLSLHSLLPALQPELLDSELHAIDCWLLGVTPAAWLNQFNTPLVIEWFSFFYFGYLWVLAAILLPTLFLGRGPRMLELLFGALVITSVGHIAYTFVPAYGPYVFVAFAQPLDGRFWWSIVDGVVSRSGALLDVFPSLHTAHPVFFAIHAVTYRKSRPWKYTWPFLTFFVVNIVASTMVLRWHYAIDVVAGIALAIGAHLLAVLVRRHESKRVSTLAVQPTWPPLSRQPQDRVTS